MNMQRMGARRRATTQGGGDEHADGGVRLDGHPQSRRHLAVPLPSSSIGLVAIGTMDMALDADGMPAYSLPACFNDETNPCGAGATIIFPVAVAGRQEPCTCMT